MDAERLRALLAVNRTIMAELDPDAVLRRVLEVAREQTGAAYAAIGVLDPSGAALERFITSGLDEPTHRAIGDLPHGRGVLGLLIDDPRALRLDDVGSHPSSYGFPAGHPPMASFLGVPIAVRGETWGNLYLTEKTGGGPFSEVDEEIACTLADSAAIAIENARLYEAERARRRDLERANRALETTTELSRALGGVTDVDRTLELITKRSRALLGARTAELAVLDGEDFVIRAVAGPGVDDLVGRRIPITESVAHAGAGQRHRPASRRAPRQHAGRPRARRPPGAGEPAHLPRRAARRARRPRPRGRRRGLHGRRRAPAGRVRGQRRGGPRHGPHGDRRGPAAQHRGLRGGTPPLGARAARRDAAGARAACASCWPAPGAAATPASSPPPSTRRRT